MNTIFVTIGTSTSLGEKVHFWQKAEGTSARVRPVTARLSFFFFFAGGCVSFYCVAHVSELTFVRNNVLLEPRWMRCRRATFRSLTLSVSTRAAQSLFLSWCQLAGRMFCQRCPFTSVRRINVKSIDWCVTISVHECCRS